MAALRSLVMTEPADRIDVKSFPSRAAMPWLVGAAVYALLIVLGPKLLNDPDSYWQIAAGNWIFSHGAVPRADPFSLTMHGAPWIAFEWLSELIYAAVFAISGWTGVVVIAAAAIALAFGLLTRFLLRALAPTPTLILVLAALVLAAPHMLARPHVLVMPIMVAWVAALVGAMDRQARPPYAALPLLVLWANMHGSVIVGIGLIGAAGLEALLREDKPSQWPRVILRWTPFTVLALLASCLTPYGLESLLIPVKTLGLGDALNTIAEWRPQDFGHFDAFEAVLLLGIFALSRGLTLPLVRTLVLLGLLHFALAHTRNADLLAMLAPLYLAQPLGRQLASRFNDTGTGPQLSARVIGLAAAGLTIVATGLAVMRPVAPDPRNTPLAAIDATDLAKAGPVLNDYAFGGYLISIGIPPFIDGRGEIYGADFINRYNRAISLANLPDFIKLLDQYHIRATLLAPDTPAVALLDRLPDWQRVYADKVAVVHKRRGGDPATVR